MTVEPGNASTATTGKRNNRVYERQKKIVSNVGRLPYIIKKLIPLAISINLQVKLAEVDCELSFNYGIFPLRFQKKSAFSLRDSKFAEFLDT